MQAVQNAPAGFRGQKEKKIDWLWSLSRENSYVVSPLTTDRLYLEKYIQMIRSRHTDR